MAHDYKDTGSKPEQKSKTKSKAAPSKPVKKRPAATPAKPKVEGGAKKGMSPLLAMSLGLGIGLTVAVYVYLSLQPKGGDTASTPASEVAAKPSAESVIKKSASNATESEEEQGSRFDFYSILPKLEVVIPDQEIMESSDKGESGHSKPTLKPIDQPGRYLLQAGSFRNSSDAERVRAELALLGVESHIETVTINNSDTWHRVRIGPFDDNKKLDKVRNRLLDNGVDVMVLKVKS